TLVATGVGAAIDLEFDGTRIWSTSEAGALFIVTPAATTPWPVTTVGFPNMSTFGLVFAGNNIWMADNHANGQIHRLDSNGAILQSVDVNDAPALPVYDGANIWVPRQGGSSVAIIRSTDGTILPSPAENGLVFPFAAAFDGERILVTNQDS